ncbi:hypothetical protein GA0061096_2690 [Fictibacillus enclensis]|uniref:hypothetical protein n=1 Tax=Fictibacillus enclensis TaxID=1017270 RepID=UPI000815E613|nr:hypothetical protein [Fictibacillus enclensis]SCC15370.1 hypothetical protein GA0061096_2690 [Fictibacillus enclensis]
MNRQWTEDEIEVAELLQELQRKTATLHISDESFLEDVKEALPKLKQLLQEVERALD